MNRGDAPETPLGLSPMSRGNSGDADDPRGLKHSGVKNLEIKGTHKRENSIPVLRY